MANYFCVRGQKRYGPFSVQQLKDLASKGQIQPDDVIQSEDGKTRSYARDIPKLLPGSAVPPRVADSVSSSPPKQSDNACSLRLVSLKWGLLTYATLALLISLVGFFRGNAWEGAAALVDFLVGGYAAWSVACNRRRWRILLAVLVLCHVANTCMFLIATPSAFLPAWLPYPLLLATAVLATLALVAAIVYCWLDKGEYRSNIVTTSRQAVVVGIASFLGISLVRSVVVLGCLLAVRTKAQDAIVKLRLLTIAEAFRAYEDRNNHFPLAGVGRNPHVIGGKSFLSWRVLLLPYLGRLDLYKQFKLDEPWDSPHNLPLQFKMPDVYSLPSEGHPFETYWKVFVTRLQKSGAPPQRKVDAVFLEGYDTCSADIRDGLDSTILVVESGDPVSWTKPDDLMFSEELPVPRLGGHFRSGFYAAFVDGHVEYIENSIDEAVLRALITRRGSEQLENTESGWKKK